MPGTLLARLGRMTDIVCRVDKRDVGERLRKVAQLALSADIVFFGEQPNVVTQPVSRSNRRCASAVRPVMT